MYATIEQIELPENPKLEQRKTCATTRTCGTIRTHGTTCLSVSFLSVIISIWNTLNKAESFDTIRINWNIGTFDTQRTITK